MSAQGEGQRDVGEIMESALVLVTAFSQEQWCGPCTTANLDSHFSILALRHPMCAPIPEMSGHCNSHVLVHQHQHAT